MYSALNQKRSKIFGVKINCETASKGSKTTEIYSHVSNKDRGKIKSPLDLIMKNSDIENEVEEYED
uniref:Tyr recombinase domain-containing protein n=1 Tax=Candidatus Methanophaga sp. ANME-1 ERB7 TaxID=2759913 RepID=A0A7G9Z746_9EURY|nr:hypothetical protein GIJIEOGM_00021 [Methanosarcinales archaeon ANME-1 ERB7]